MSLGDTTYPDPLVPLQETGTGMALLYAGAGGLLAAMLAKGSKKARVQTIAAGTAAGGVLSVLMRPMRGRKVWHKKIRPRPYIRAGAELEAAGWGALERGRGRVRVAARHAAQLPLRNPLFNLREAAKELLLLEDHLGHPQKHCPDCIRKHLLTTEALLEEAVRLDTEGEKLGLLSPLPAQVRELWTAYQDGRPKHEIGQSARVLRKGLVEASAAVRVGAPGTYQRSSAPWNGYGAGEAAIVASATRRGVEWPLSAPKAPTNALKKIAVTLGAYLLVVSLWKAGSRRPR